MKLLILLLSLCPIPALATTWKVTTVSCQEGNVKPDYFLQPESVVTDNIQQYHPVIISHEKGTEIQAIFIDDPRDPDKACENTTRPTTLTISLTMVSRY